MADPDNPVDITGYEARLQVRRRLGDADALLDLSDAPGEGLTITGAEGLIALDVGDDVTAALNFSTGVFDLEVEAPDGTVTELDSGRAVFKREVTR